MKDCQGPTCDKRSPNPIDHGWFELDGWRSPRATNSQLAFCSLTCIERWIELDRNDRPKRSKMDS